MIEQPLETHRVHSRPISARTRTRPFSFAANPLSQFRLNGESLGRNSFPPTRVKCTVCQEKSDAGANRFVCLICKNLDLCESCHGTKRVYVQNQHRSYHPVQPIVPRKQLCGTGQLVADLGLFCCALCGDKELTVDQLVDHCQRHHADSPNLVRCPVCVTFGLPAAPDASTDGRTLLLQHLRAEHWNSEAKMTCKMCNKACSDVDRFACLICENYQLCGSCHLNKVQTEEHMPFHPMQLVQPMETLRDKLNPKAEPTMTPTTSSRSEELQETHQELQIYTCSYCGEKNLGVMELAQHCQDLHHGQEHVHMVRCPVCAVLRVPIQESTLVIAAGGLLEHLVEYHCTEELAAPTTSASSRT